MHRSRTAVLIAVTLAFAWITLPKVSWAGRGFNGLPRPGYATPMGDADQYTGVVSHHISVPARPVQKRDSLVVRIDRSGRLQIVLRALGLARTILGAYGTIYVEQ
jgi:hypothetical protein